MNTLIWTKSCSLEMAADPETIWNAMADVSTWPLWNAGVKAIEIEGSFTTGTWFAMTLPDDDVIRLQLVEVSAPWHFADETRIDETVIRVDHRIEALADAPGGNCRVTYTTTASGPQAEAFGEGASADFPDVLANLAKFVVSREG